MACINYREFLVILLFLIVNVNSDDCTCHPIEKKFNETIKDVVDKKCRKCFMFTYDFTLDEDWAASLCVSSPLVSPHTPLLVVAREYLGVTSLQVPQIFEDEWKSYFTDVCRTLCPLANYFDDRLNVSQQRIYVEVSTESEEDVDFEVRLSTVNDFILVEDQPLTVNITPSEPRVLQYNMAESLQAVRIEAESADRKCMILSIEDVQCPFSDSDSTLGRSGFYQTLMRRSGIFVTKRTFPMARMYISLILKTSNGLCTESTESYESETIPARYRSKEVTVRIVPAITDPEYYVAVFVVLVPYILAYLIALCVCCCSRKKAKGNLTIEDGGSSVGSFTETMPVGRGDEADLPAPAKLEPLRVRTKIYLSDLTRKKEDVLSKRSKVYLWNLIAIAIFFSVPAFQLVFINQGVVNLTGNQDMCYYNFLCSYHFGPFSDFNHFYSNIGYVMLGILFLLIVRRREIICKEQSIKRHREGTDEEFGIPFHFGLFYAMGAASIVEGVLSATYHVCPNKANFQFDTAFMYVIVAMCMLRLYQARHPDITARSHKIWIILSLVIFVNGADVMIPWTHLRLAYHIIFGLIYLVAVFFVSVKIYYMGCEKFNKGILKHVYQNRESAKGNHCCGFYVPEYRVQFIMFILVMVINIICVILHWIEQGDSASFFLQVFILNLIIYIIYYIVMKIKRFILKKYMYYAPVIYLALAIGFWFASVVFFVDVDTQWEQTPAESRELNNRCYTLNFYDRHDVWHFLSSFAIFCSYMLILTMDEDLQDEPRSEIEVF